jgi:hypothetical protein
MMIHCHTRGLGKQASESRHDLPVSHTILDRVGHGRVSGRRFPGLDGG